MKYENTISCIFCVNNKNQYKECLYYLNRQILPAGYNLEYIPVYNASSMSEGYNRGMQKATGKVKIYLHQDTFFVNPYAISHAIYTFKTYPDIGIIGVIGKTKLEKNHPDTMNYDVGIVLHNNGNHIQECPSNADGFIYDVENIDGLCMITCYDLPLNENVFDGWDFYDASLCHQFINAGMRVVVIGQGDEPWCFHDNSFNNYKFYYHYKKLFMDMYYSDFKYNISPQEIVIQEISAEKTKMISVLSNIIDSGQIPALIQFFTLPDNCGYSHLRDFEIIASTIYAEELNNSTNTLFKSGSFTIDLVNKINELKYYLRRIDMDACDQEDTLIKNIIENYSLYLISEIIERYVINKEKLYSHFHIK